MFKDHKQIFDVLIRSWISQLDSSRPFLASSPSNDDNKSGLEFIIFKKFF